MSWDIVLVSSSQKIASLEEVEEDQLININFGEILDAHFPNAIKDDDHRQVEGEGFSFDYYSSSEPSSTMLVNLYGEKALFQIIPIAKKCVWQIFDTGSGEMLDLKNPSKNGFSEFLTHLNQVFRRNH